MDIIDRIGQFFADQEAQMRVTMDSVSVTHGESLAHKSKPSSLPLRRVGSAPQQQPLSRSSPKSAMYGGEFQPTPLLRRRFEEVTKLSRQQVGDDNNHNNATARDARHDNGSASDNSTLLRTKQTASAWTKTVSIPSDKTLTISRERNKETDTESVDASEIGSGSDGASTSGNESDGSSQLESGDQLLSTFSSWSSASTSSSALERPEDSEDSWSSQDKSKTKSLRKKKHRKSASKHDKKLTSQAKQAKALAQAQNQAQEATARAAKLQEAFVLTQERARKIQMERIRQQKEVERRKQEEQERLQSQLQRIEEVRSRTLRLRPRSAPTTPTGQGSRTDLSCSTTFGSPGLVGLLQRKSQSFRQERAISQWFPSDSAKEAHQRATSATNVEPRAVIETPMVIPLDTKPSREFLDSLEHEWRQRLNLKLSLATRILAKRSQVQQQAAKRETQKKRILHEQQLKQSRIQQLQQLVETLQGDLQIVLQQEATSRQERIEAEKQVERNQKLHSKASSTLLALQQLQDDSQLIEQEILRTKEAALARAKAQERVKERAMTKNSLSFSLAADFETIQQLKAMTTTKAKSQPKRTMTNPATTPQRASGNQQQQEQQKQHLEHPIVAWETPEIAEFEEEGLQLRPTPQAKTKAERPIQSTCGREPSAEFAANAMLQTIRCQVQQNKSRATVENAFRDVHPLASDVVNKILESDILSDEE